MVFRFFSRNGLVKFDVLFICWRIFYFPKKSFLTEMNKNWRIVSCGNIFGIMLTNSN